MTVTVAATIDTICKLNTIYTILYTIYYYYNTIYYTIYHILYTIYYILYTIYYYILYILYTIILYIIYYILYTIYYYYILYLAYYTIIIILLYTIHYTILYTIYTILYTLYYSYFHKQRNSAGQWNGSLLEGVTPNLEHRVIQPEPNMGHHGEKTEVCHMHLPSIKSLPVKSKHHMNQSSCSCWPKPAQDSRDKQEVKKGTSSAVYSQ